MYTYTLKERTPAVFLLSALTFLGRTPPLIELGTRGVASKLAYTGLTFTFSSWVIAPELVSYWYPFYTGLAGSDSSK